jgi:hypothetical protein
MIAAISLYLIMELADVLSTVLVMAYVPGSMETNPYLRNPVTLKFVPILALYMKSLFSAVCLGLPALAIFAGTRSWLLASLPFWYWTIGHEGIAVVVFRNLAYLFVNS